jgi:dipeptidyl aminopeptidase/acylaminoacyl peptidase
VSAGRRRLAASLAVLALAAVISLAGPGPSFPAPREAGQAGDFTIEHLLSIAHPGPPVWSPDGARIAFVRERDGAVDLWWTSADGEEPVAVTREAGKAVPASVAAFSWTADGGSLLYVQGSDLFLYEVSAETVATLVGREASVAAPVLSPDGSRLAMLRDGRPWVGSFPGLEGGYVLESEASFSTLAWSTDGRFLAATASESRVVVEETLPLVGAKLAFSRRDTSPADLALIDVEEATVRWMERGDAYSGGATFSADGRLAWQEISADAKGRRILVASAPEWTPRVLVDERDDAWWTLTYLDAGPRWSPSGDRLAFISERDGWAHVYLVEEGGDAPRQLTRGEFEVEEPAWSPDGRRLLLSANKGSRTERGLHLLDVPPAGSVGEPTLEPISRLRGTSTFGRWRPDGGAVAFLHADPESPLDLWVQEPAPAVAQQLSDAWPEGVDGRDLVRPQAVRFSSSDGELIPAQLFMPPGHEDSAEPLPAVVWVHGGGIRQNRYGWHPLRAYAVFYGFHQYLLQQGYVVVTVDYRGSIGNGRAFRQGQHMDLGGRDLDDVLAARRYLRRMEDFEVGRIGVWGISYGGYLTLQALVQAPGAFAAGIDVAGVADWADWSIDPGGLWIDGRMGDPAASPELFRERSPMHFVERLSEPLLILHGTADRSVPVLQTIELADALVRAGRPFDMMIYPGEEHAFVRAHTWRDAFRRVEAFWDATLR